MEIKSFPGTEDSLDLLRDYIQEIAKRAGLTKKATYNLMLATDEIATNIILYGYQQAGLTGNVDVRVEEADGKLTVTLEDTAVPFDPLAKPLPDEEQLSLPLEERAIGGLGIYLTVNGVDEFRYEYVDGRNRNSFVMNLPPNEA